MIKTIKDKIITNLETLDDINNVYGYPIAMKTSGFPYAIVTWEGEEAEILTNRQDRVYDTYRIRVIQEKLEEFKGSSEAEEITENRTDDILGLFRAEYTLDGLVMRTTPIKVEKAYDQNATRIIISILLRTDRAVNIS